jgi:hypothetical protein
MELTPYQQAARTVVAEFGKWNPLDERLHVLVINDDQSGNYLAVLSGWDDDLSVYQPLLHLRVADATVIVECHTTDEEVTHLLVEQGVAYKDIVLSAPAVDAVPNGTRR